MANSIIVPGVGAGCCRGDCTPAYTNPGTFTRPPAGSPTTKTKVEQVSTSIMDRLSDCWKKMPLWQKAIVCMIGGAAVGTGIAAIFATGGGIAIGALAGAILVGTGVVIYGKVDEHLFG
jgi:hypothetical protein